MKHAISGDEFISILNQVLAQAKVKGLTSKELARRCGITPETLSRMKSRRSGDFAILNKMAMVVGLRLALVPDNQILDDIRNGKLF